MALSKLEKQDGHFVCPTCGGSLEFVEGGAVQVVDGKLDMEAAKSRYECGVCNVFYREVMNTGFFDVFPLNKTAPKKKKTVEKDDNPCSKDPVALKKDASGECICPNCNKSMRFVEGGAVRVVDGKVDMESVKPTYECDECNVFYREVLSSGFYHAYPLEKRAAKKEEPKKEVVKKEKKKVVSVGDLPPMALKRDANGQCECPRCGEMMNYVEGGAVTIVDGKPDMENVKARFVCDACHSVYRQIVNTEYYQWAEK